MKKLLSLLLTILIFSMSFNSYLFVCAKENASPALWTPDFLDGTKFNEGAVGFPSDYVFDISSMRTKWSSGSTGFYAEVPKELFQAIAEGKHTVTLIDGLGTKHIYKPGDIASDIAEQTATVYKVGSRYRKGSSYIKMAASIAAASDMNIDADSFKAWDNCSFLQIISGDKAVTACEVRLSVTSSNNMAGGVIDSTAGGNAAYMYDCAVNNSLYIYEYASGSLTVRPTQTAVAAEKTEISFERSNTVIAGDTGDKQYFITDRAMRSNDIVYGLWRDEFVKNGEFNTSAQGFPEDYTFNLVTANAYRSRITNQISTSVKYGIKKELFYAVKHSGQTVKLLDDCASYIISPEDITADITEDEFGEIVYFGSCFRTGASYPPTARKYATAQGIIGYDDQFRMGEEFVFWQYNDFPNNILSGCDVELRVQNGGRVEYDNVARDFDGIQQRFYEYAKAESLYAYVYYNREFYGASQPDNNTMLYPSAAEDGKSVRFYLRSGTGYNKRCYLLSNINPVLNANTTAQSEAAAELIAALPETVGTSDSVAVKTARRAYEGLSYSAKALIAEDYKLFAAETELLIAKISDNVTLEDEEAIFKAKKAYSALESNAAAAVGNVQKLSNALNSFELLRPAIKVACVGDSITKGSYAANLKTKSYPARLQEMLGNEYKVLNFGVGGSTLLKNGNKPYWNQQYYKDSLDFKPDIVIIMLGSNDAKAVNWDTYGSEYGADMKALVESYRALDSDPKVYIATSPTVYDTLVGISDSVVSGKVVPLQKQAAEALNCALIDVNSATKDKSDLFVDGVHAKDDGYFLIAKTMFKGLGITCKHTAVHYNSRLEPTVMHKGMSGDCYCCHCEEKLYNSKELSALGDLNGDSEVDLLDLIRLKKYVSSSNTNITEGTGDLDKDGEIDSVDIAIMRKSLLDVR